MIKTSHSHYLILFVTRVLFKKIDSTSIPPQNKHNVAALHQLKTQRYKEDQKGVRKHTDTKAIPSPKQQERAK